MLPQLTHDFKTTGEIDAALCPNICSQELEKVFGDMGFEVVWEANSNQAFVGFRLNGKFSGGERGFAAEKVVTSSSDSMAETFLVRES